MSGILDTSVFIARERDRPLGELPAAGMVSVMTVAELRVGVLLARDEADRGKRMRTLSEVERREPVPIDDTVARAFAEIAAAARADGKRPKVVDALIAATARSLDIPVYTQDANFDGMPGVEVVRV